MFAIGDITERVLGFFGITKERVQSAMGKKDCGCAKRQKAMNEWGYRWQHRLGTPICWLRLRWQIIRHLEFWQRLHIAGYYVWLAGRVLFWGR